MNQINDRAGEHYWSSVWNATDLPSAVDTSNTSLGNWINVRYHLAFSEVLKNIQTKGMRMLEVGCGNSVWLPYFNTHFGMHTDGLDYSEVGCENSRRIFKRDGIDGTIYHADMFAPPENLVGKYDLVLSMGVIEHFSDTDAVVRALKKFLKPGGVLITSLPNHNGLLGWIVKTFNRPLFDIHYLVDVKHLREGYEHNGIEVSYLDYVLCPSFFLNLDQNNGKLGLMWFRKLVAKLLAAFSLALIFLDKNKIRLPVSRTISPAILAVGRVPS